MKFDVQIFLSIIFFPREPDSTMPMKKRLFQVTKPVFTRNCTFLSTTVLGQQEFVTMQLFIMRAIAYYYLYDISYKSSPCCVHTIYQKIDCEERQLISGSLIKCLVERMKSVHYFHSRWRNNNLYRFQHLLEFIKKRFYRPLKKIPVVKVKKIGENELTKSSN